MKKPSLTFSTRIGLLKHLPGMHYIEIPRGVVEALKARDPGKLAKRVICTVSKKLTFQGGLVALLLIENLKRLPLGKEIFREMLGLRPRRD